MRLINYTQNGSNHCGMLLQDWLFDLHAAVSYFSSGPGETAFNTLAELSRPDGYLYSNNDTRAHARTLLDEISKTLPSASSKLLDQGVLIPLERMSFLPSVYRPGKIVCVGLNYPEPGVRKPTSRSAYPVLFLKPASALIGHDKSIILPRGSKQVLYEGELAVVIGRTARHVPPQQAWTCIAGYTIANDVSAKDFEKRTSQWTSGKISDTFCPLGPLLVTTDEVSDPQDLRIHTTLNGSTVQEGSTADMLFGIPELISYVSSLATLQPGDLILTGSPKGIGVNPANPIYMNPGDTVSIKIEGLGVLTNPVIAEE